MSKVLFGAVLYKQARPYLSDFVNSIKNQSNKDAELLFLNDNYPAGELEEALLECGLDQDQYHLVETGGKYSPAMLRVELLLEAKKLDADLIIIGDADDTFLPDRVEKIVAAFEKDRKAAFYYNDLVDEQGMPIFDKLPEICGGNEDKTFLVDSNFLGMSTTGINLSKLRLDWIETLREGDTHIFDWYLYERLGLDIGYGIYVKETGTVYRLHAGNLAGNQTTDFSIEYLEKEKAVKLEHYELMARRYPEYEKYKKALLNVDLYKLEPVKNGYWWSKIRCSGVD